MCVTSNKKVYRTPFNITPHNTNKLTNAQGRTVVTSGISFSAAGTLTIQTVGGQDVTIPSGSLLPGIIHNIAAKMVYSGTTAANIIGYYDLEM